MPQLIFFFLILFVPSLFSNKELNADRELKVMTYNIWNGFDWGKDTARKANFITWVNEKQPDVLALQELCGYDEEKLKTDAKQWGHTFVAILKTDGYPVGLTSKEPILLKEKILDSLWHGMLHCEAYGIDFFVVHLSPADCRYRQREARLITQKIIQSNSKQFIVLGDFNAHSPFDAQRMEEKTSLREKYMKAKSEKNYSNLLLGEFDYSVIAQFLSLPAIDVCLKKTDVTFRHTFPTPVLYENTKDLTYIENIGERIDYILVSPALAKSSSKAKIFNKEKTHSLSDHYPVMAVFQIN